MEEKLALQVEVITKLTQLDGLLDKLDKLDELTEKFREQTKKTDKVLEKLGRNEALNKLINQLKSLQFALKGVSSITGLVAGAFSKAFDLGKSFFDDVVNAAQYKQGALTTLETFLGSRDAAKEEFAKVLKIATQTPADTEELLETTKSLFTAGFDKEQVNTLRAFATDIQALFGSNEKMKEFTDLLVRIKNTGKLQGDEKNSLYRFVQGNLFEKHLATLLKIKGTEQQINEEVKKRISAGKISADMALKAAILANKEKLGEQSLGDFAMKMASQSLGGSVSNFKNAFKDMLKSLDFDNIPGIKSFATFLNNITNQISSPEFTNAIRNIIQEIFGGFDKIDGAKIESFFKDKIIPALVTVKEIIADTWNFLGNLLNSKDFAGVGVAIVKALKDAFYYIGLFIGAGIKEALYGNPEKDKVAGIDAAADTEFGPGVFNPENRLGADINPKGDSTPVVNAPKVNITVNAETNASPQEIGDAAVKSFEKFMSENARNEARMKGKLK